MYRYVPNVDFPNIFWASLRFHCQSASAIPTVHLRNRSGVEAADGPTDCILKGLAVWPRWSWKLPVFIEKTTPKSIKDDCEYGKKWKLKTEPTQDTYHL